MSRVLRLVSKNFKFQSGFFFQHFQFLNSYWMSKEVWHGSQYLLPSQTKTCFFMTQPRGVKRNGLRHSKAIHFLPQGKPDDLFTDKEFHCVANQCIVHVCSYKGIIFSSPELKAQVSFSDHLSSIVCLSVCLSVCL